LSLEVFAIAIRWFALRGAARQTLHRHRGTKCQESSESLPESRAH